VEVRSLLCDQKQVYEYAALVAGERKAGLREVLGQQTTDGWGVVFGGVCSWV